MIVTRELYKVLSGLIDARKRREQKTDESSKEWFSKHSECIYQLVKNYMPSGSGIDCGTEIDLDKSTSEKLVFTMSYHHMDQNGMYSGWTDHTVIVRASLQFDFDLRITGRDRNSIKEYLYETYDFALRQLISIN